MSFREYLLNGTALELLSAFLPFVVPIAPRPVADGGYQISHSLRCNSADSPRLSRTCGTPTSRRTWTVSFWVKRGKIDSGTTSYGVFGGFDGVSTFDTFLFYQDTIYVSGANALRIQTNRLFRDPTAWMHVVYVWDTTQAQTSATASDSRVRLYVNGVQITSFSSSSMPSQNTDSTRWNVSGVTNYINGYWTSNSFFDGYLADFIFVDGQALSPTDFGEFDATTGAWVPKAYAGTYGNNGFWLDFSDDTALTSSTLGKDRSGNNNDWTPTNFALGETTGYLGSGDRTAAITVTSSMTPVGGTLSNLVDGGTGANSTDAVSFSFLTVTSGTTYIKFDLGRKTRVYSFNTDTGAAPNNDWKWQGSDDDSSWTDVTASETWTNDKSWTCTVAANYRYYRIIATSSGTHGNAWTIEITFSVSSTGTDVLTDTPTNYGTDAGLGGEVRGNYATWNPLHKSATGSQPTLSNGNLTFTGVSQGVALSTQPLQGKVYAEVHLTTLASYAEYGIGGVDSIGTAGTAGSNPGQWSAYFNGTSYVMRPGFDATQIYATVGNGICTQSGDIGLIAVDVPNNKIWLGRNRAGVVTWIGDGDPSAGTSPTFSGAGGGGVHSTAVNLSTHPFYLMVAAYTTSVWNLNAGQRPFSTTVPSGFKAVCTQNIPTPAISKLSNGFVKAQAAHTSIQTDLATLRSGWSSYVEAFKRTDSTEGWRWRFSDDTGNYLDTSSQNAKTTFPSLSGTYVAYAIRCDNGYPARTGTVSHTNGVASTVTHNLGNARCLIIVKNEGAGSTDWFLYHPDRTAGKLMKLNTTGGEASNSTITSVGANSFQIGSGTATGTYRYVVIAETEGFFDLGSYSGNANADGPYEWKGLRPAWSIFNRYAGGTSNWISWDSTRDVDNYVDKEIYLDSTAAEATAGSGLRKVDFVAGGLKVRGTGDGYINVSAAKHITATFGESFKYARAA